MRKEGGISDQAGNDGEDGVAPPWVAEFLAGLIVTGSVRQAVAEVGIEFETAWALRRKEPAFARYWDGAIQVYKAVGAGVPYFDAIDAVEAAGVHG